ncbi:macrolide transporter [Alkalihalobacillus macyae]|uniref:Macrolide transporter n=1 Tax=Guptibacillus hwajinpoensis TaxID=208199 RepID=A0A0J6CS13_9BACL|nr:macrolide transporter [Alkalihalobacillus macyae]
MAVKEELEGLTEQVPSIFKNRNFLFLWAAALLSSFGISFFLFSESWYIVNVLNLEASLGFIYIASSVPRIIFMVISGTVADRLSKTKIMFMSDFSRSILLGGLVLWFVFGDITLWTFVGVAFVFGILDAFFWAAESAVIPSIIHKDNLTRGNSIIQMTNQASFILAPMLAGLIIAFGNYEIVFATTAVMLLVASVLIYLIRVPLSSSSDSLTEKSFWSSFKEGVQYVRNSRPLMLIVLTTIFLNLFLVGPMTMGLPLFVKSVLEGNAVYFSLLEAALAGGMLIGAIVIGVLNVSRNRGHIALVALLIAGLAFMGFSFAETLWLSMVMLGVFGACLSCCNIPFISAVQSMIEESMLGRVMGLISLASMGLIPVSYVITSLVLSMGISINTIMSAGAILLVLYSTFVYAKFTELREIT